MGEKSNRTTGYVAPSIQRKAEDVATQIMVSILSQIPDVFLIEGDAYSGKSVLINEIERLLIDTGIVDVVRELGKTRETKQCVYINDESELKPTPTQIRSLTKGGAVVLMSALPGYELDVPHVKRIRVPELEADEIAQIVYDRVSPAYTNVDKETVFSIVRKICRFEKRLNHVIKATIFALSETDTITDAVVARACKKAGVPYIKYQSSEEIYEKLVEKIAGQDDAMREIAAAVSIFTTNTLSKPTVILLGGPSGVGKSYCVEVLSKILDVPLHIEYLNQMKAQHSMSTLLGAPPGYVGFDKKPPFVQFIDKHPCGAIVLFDEIDKASDSLCDTLMSFLETGIWTDARGIKHQTRSYIVVMTTNETELCTSVGFCKTGDVKAVDLLPSMRKEFVSRIDYVIRFKPIALEYTDRIIDCMVQQEEEELDQKTVDMLRLKVNQRKEEIKKLYSKDIGVRQIRTFIRKIKSDAIRENAEQ